MWQRLLWHKHLNIKIKNNYSIWQVNNKFNHEGRCNQFDQCTYLISRKFPYPPPPKYIYRYRLTKLPHSWVSNYEISDELNLLVFIHTSRNTYNHMNHPMIIILTKFSTGFIPFYRHIMKKIEREIHTFNIWSCAILLRNSLLWEKLQRPSKGTD